MNTYQISIDEIKPYKNNTKKHDERQIKNVAESIRQYGFVQPLVIDANNEIVIGHCRFEAAKVLEMETIPCVRVDDLTPAQVRALRIVDNKTNESPWDFGALDLEISDIDLDGFDFDFVAPSFVDVDSLFIATEQKNDKEPKKIQCPHCGEYFEI